MAPDAKLQLGDYLLPIVRGVAPPGRVVLPGGLLWLRIGRKQCQTEAKENVGKAREEKRGSMPSTVPSGLVTDSGGSRPTYLRYSERSV